jgi:hypothetical protein
MDKGIPAHSAAGRRRRNGQKYLPPAVKTTAANGQSNLPSLVSLELPLTVERESRGVPDFLSVLMNF